MMIHDTDTPHPPSPAEDAREMNAFPPASGESNGDVDIDVQNDRGFLVNVDALKKAAVATLRAQSVVGDATLSLVIADNATMRQLNRQYRGIDASTDVLSFPAEALPDLPDLPGIEPDVEEGEAASDYLGDLVIAYPYASDQAARLGHDISQSLQLLVVHGCLHLLGYDHDTPEHRAQMWQAQAEVLSEIGVDLAIVPLLEEVEPHPPASPAERARWQRIYAALTGTSQIDPGEYAAQISPNRLRSLGYALAGWLYMLRRQKNTRIMSVASAAVLGLSLWLQISNVELSLILVMVTIVWLTEFLNAGIEAAVDLASPELHPLAQVGKDVASAAVLLGVIASIIVGVLILGPPLLGRLGITG